MLNGTQQPVVRTILLVGGSLFLVSGCRAPAAEGTSVLLPADTLTLEPGQSHDLSGNLTIRFGRSGTEFAVPDVIFGESYVLDDPENINHLPIRGTVRVYDDGRAFSLTTIGCGTEVVMTDVPERHVVGCTVEVRVEPMERPTIAGTSLTETLEGSDATRPVYRPNYVTTVQGAEASVTPLLYVGIPEFFLQDWRRYPAGIIIGGAPDVGGGEGYELVFPIVTNFGAAEVTYLPGELFDEVEKAIRIGPATVSIVPEKHVVADRNTHDDFSFVLSLDIGEDAGARPVRILDFSY